MTSQGGSSRKSLSLTNSASQGKKKAAENGDSTRKSLSSSRSMGLTGERTVKRLRLSKALTVPENTTIYEACRRMAARRVDALLLTDSNALLSGILTDKDIATRVIAREVNLEETPVSKVMTRNPVFVLSDTLAVEALQKMVQGKFRHLPVVENGEVIALLDIAKCLYDAIARMERAAEKGKAIAAAVEGVEKHWGTSISGPNTFIETLRERMFKPSLSTIIPENSKLVRVSPTDTVLMATKQMLEYRLSSAVVTVDNKPRGILTSKDILMRIIAQNLPPDTTLVEKVMTPNPECATVDTPIVDALHTMHDGKFLHLPVVDRDGNVAAVVDVIHITHAAVATVGNSVGVNNEAASTMMQKFWDSAMALGPTDDDEDTRSEGSFKLASEGTETGRSLPYPSSAPPSTFSFKIEDKKGRMHRFNCDIRNLTDLITSILQRVGDDIDSKNLPQILYEDEDHDKVVLANAIVVYSSASSSTLILSNETTSSFVWAFEQFKFAMPGADPVMIITDQAAAIANAISTVFPNTLHRLCIWHIQTKFSAKLDATSSDYNYKAFHDCIWYSETCEEFDSWWQSVLEKTNTVGNEWLESIFALRSRWVPAYCNDVFSARMASSQRVEGAHAFFKNYISRQNSLMEFIIRFNRALSHQRNKELEKNHADLTTKPLLKSVMAMEEQMAGIYTRTVFLKFQAELMAMLACVMKAIREDENEIAYNVVERHVDGTFKQRTICYDKVEDYAKCSCRKFQAKGIPCKHLLAFLRMVAQKEYLPEVYILRRWTQAVDAEIIVDDHGSTIHGVTNSSLLTSKSKLYQNSLLS